MSETFYIFRTDPKKHPAALRECQSWLLTAKSDYPLEPNLDCMPLTKEGLREAGRQMRARDIKLKFEKPEK